MPPIAHLVTFIFNQASELQNNFVDNYYDFKASVNRDIGCVVDLRE